MLDCPTTINIEQLNLSFIIYQLLETIEEQEDVENLSKDEKELYYKLTEQMLFEIINSLEPLEE